MNCTLLIGTILATIAVENPASEKSEANPFYTLPMCTHVDGVAEVRTPDTQLWVELEEGIHYPLGSAYRTQGEGEATISFGKEASVSISGDSSFESRFLPLSAKNRVIVPLTGTVEVKTPTTLPSGLFEVTTKSLVIRDVAGASKYVNRATTEGQDITVRCVTGTIAVEGRHFKIPQMRAADEFRMRSSHDELVTVLYGKSGDYVVSLDRGLVGQPSFLEDGSVKYVYTQQHLPWHLSVGTHVQITRAKMNDTGDRLGVSMLTFNSAGEIRNHFAFTETRYENNTGELIAQQAEEEDASKGASETTDGEATDVEDEEAEESSSSSDSSDDDSSDDDSSEDSSSDDEEEDDDDL